MSDLSCSNKFASSVKTGRKILRISFVQPCFVTKCSVFWDVTKCSPMKVNLRFVELHRFQLQCQRVNQVRNQPTASFMLISFLIYLLTLKMDVIFSSETSVDFRWTTLRYISEDGTSHNHRWENLKSTFIKHFLRLIFFCFVWISESLHTNVSYIIITGYWINIRKTDDRKYML
jgi:hypothetical protein